MGTRSLTRTWTNKIPVSLCVTLICCAHLQTDTVYEYMVSDTDMEWMHWQHLVPSWEYPKKEEKPKFAQLVIPTLDR